MDNEKRFVTGLDVGTENVRAVIASVGKDGQLAIVGYSEGKSAGMRKGVPANLAGPAGAIDRMLGDAERMGGYDVRSAYVSINGSQILSTKTEGMIAVGTVEHEISDEDLDRVEDVAVSGRIPANRDVLEVVPLEYALDGQGGIKDPLGMAGARLEMRANVISALTPNCENLRKSTAAADVKAERLIPSVVAAAKAVLTERQKENGVAVIDFGATTTSVAVYEEGDLQYVGVVPAGSNNITNDLAIVLAIDPDMAEEIKQRFVTGNFNTEKSQIIKIGKENGKERNFERKEVEEVVKARLEEIFGEIRKKLKIAKYDQRLPEGIILTGGGAKMRDIDLFAKNALEASVKIGVPLGLDGVADAVSKPEFATSVGLAMLAAEDGHSGEAPTNKKSKKLPKIKKPSGNIFKKLFSKF
ncbi:cell division protein FtsA [Candidatus Saccharibacteria bacterium]|nr:cell division protein FtsA [Candidatus Saccharibacteria bacterium]MBR3332346.1 cell division protein FtsA [Candidatus Saccharibacteria bacterium]